MSDAKFGYMCLTDWNWELGEACGGTEVHCSIADLKLGTSPGNWTFTSSRDKRRGYVIKHEKFMDIAIFVTCVGCLEIGATSIQITGTCMNQGFVRSWFVEESISFEIDVKNLHDWYLCVDEKKDACLRKCDWTPLRYK